MPNNTPAGNIIELSDKDWEVARKRYAIILPLLGQGRNCLPIEKIAKQSGVTVRTIYRWIEKFARTGSVSSLANFENDGGRGKNRLPDEVERIIKTVIDERYLTKQKLTIKKISMEIAAQCRKAGLREPSYKAIRIRVNCISTEHKLSRRYHKSIAENKFVPLGGTFPGGDYPLDVVQIDHTELDIIIVDEVYRQPVGRPLITMAIDIYSRMVVGFYVSLDSPGALGTGLCISQAILPKEVWLSKMDIKGNWPCFGIMRSIHLDNAREFHGKMLERACQEYGIEINFRPVKTPKYGGHIERLMRTSLNEIHALPGTTFSNPVDRKNYDSEGKACFTLKELERWIGIFIVEIYHQRIHTSINTTPNARYSEGILGTNEQIGAGLSQPIENELKLRLDFMPFVERSVQRYGVVIDFIYYYHDILRKWVCSYEQSNAKSKILRKFIFKRDPRDISGVYFFDPDLKEYFWIPYRNTRHPSITVWEHRRILRDIKSKGLSEVNEDMIFEAYAKLKSIEDAAVRSTVAAKNWRNRAKKAHAIENNIRTQFGDGGQNYVPDLSDEVEPGKIYLPFEDLDNEPFK